MSEPQTNENTYRSYKLRLTGETSVTPGDPQALYNERRYTLFLSPLNKGVFKANEFFNTTLHNTAPFVHYKFIEMDDLPAKVKNDRENGKKFTSVNNIDSECHIVIETEPDSLFSLEELGNIISNELPFKDEYNAPLGFYYFMKHAYIPRDQYALKLHKNDMPFFLNEYDNAAVNLKRTITAEQNGIYKQAIIFNDRVDLVLSQNPLLRSSSVYTVGNILPKMYPNDTTPLLDSMHPRKFYSFPVKATVLKIHDENITDTDELNSNSSKVVDIDGKKYIKVHGTNYTNDHLGLPEFTPKEAIIVPMTVEVMLPSEEKKDYIFNVAISFSSW